MDRKGLHVYLEQKEISLNAGTWGRRETWTQTILASSLASTTNTSLKKESVMSDLEETCEVKETCWGILAGEGDAEKSGKWM